MKTAAILVASAAMLAGCASYDRAGPVEVTRFHLAGPTGSIERGPISVISMANSSLDAQSLEFRSYAQAVETELQRNGYTIVAPGRTTVLTARINYLRGTRANLEAGRSPVSVGIGGSTGGYRGGGVGVGVGGNLGGGGSRRGEIVTELAVAIERTSERSVVWEGRAQTEAREGSTAASQGLAAAKLAEALFRGFPGESGRTITVR